MNTNKGGNVQTLEMTNNNGFNFGAIFNSTFSQIKRLALMDSQFQQQLKFQQDSCHEISMAMQSLLQLSWL